MSLASLGWNDHVTSLYRSLCHVAADPAPARVSRVDRGRVLILADDGESGAVTAGRLDPAGEPAPPTVGDWVVTDRHSDTPVIRAILPRSSCLRRRAAGGEHQVQALAANIDLVLVVEPLDRGPNPRRIERAVAMACDAGATPIVLLSKADLVADVEAARGTACAAAPFVDVLPVSAPLGTGLDELRERLGGGLTAVLLGPSGAGKSSLANALLAEHRLVTAAVRVADARGRHTTTRRELSVLPEGGCLVDTPGLRELGLWMSAGAVDGSFPDIETLAGGCRFADCRHQREPGCEVLEAVQRGRLDAARLDSYQRLRAEAERLEQMADPLGRAELRARDRSFARLCRAELRRRGVK